MPGTTAKNVESDSRFQNVKCWRPPPPPKDPFQRPLLMPIEFIQHHKRHTFDNPIPIRSPVCMDGCSMAPVGGTSMYGAFTRSCFSCNNCGGNGRLDVCNLPCYGCNNYSCGCGFW